MIPFAREGDVLVTELDDFEVSLIASLVSQVVELVGGSAPSAPAASEDPFALWASEMGPAATLDRSDPVVARLFPDAYADEVAAAEHRRYSEEALRRARVADADVVLAGLAATREGAEPLVIHERDADAWLKTLNGVRLSLAVRLGIESESDHAELERLSARDPRTQLVSLYDWLGLVLESLLEALHA
ncbi:MAG: DUF2017 domain-containing protein [Propionibacteriaceae bacterium]|nr:DUF2017 domain-containing protein [Propionibacteriaceae bacterium]